MRKSPVDSDYKMGKYRNVTLLELKRFNMNKYVDVFGKTPYIAN